MSTRKTIKDRAKGQIRVPEPNEGGVDGVVSTGGNAQGGGQRVVEDSPSSSSTKIPLDTLAPPVPPKGIAVPKPQPVKRVADPIKTEDAQNPNGTYVGEKNDRSVTPQQVPQEAVVNAENVSGQTIQQGTINGGQGVTDGGQGTQIGGQVQQNGGQVVVDGQTPLGEPNKVQNGGQSAENVSGVAGETVVANGTVGNEGVTNLNEQMQNEKVEAAQKDAFIIQSGLPANDAAKIYDDKMSNAQQYGMTPDELSGAMSHEKFKDYQSQVAGANVEQLAKVEKNLRDVLSDPNASDEQKAAARSALVAVVDKQKDLTMRGEGIESLWKADNGSVSDAKGQDGTTDKKGVESTTNANKDAEIKTAKTPKERRAENAEILKQSKADQKKNEQDAKEFKEAHSDIKGGKGTENGGRSVDETTSTAVDGNNPIKANTPELNSNLGPDGKPIAPGKELPLTKAEVDAVLKKQKEGKALTLDEQRILQRYNNRVNNAKTPEEKAKEKAKKAEDDFDKLPSKDKIIAKGKEMLGWDDKAVEEFKKVYDENPGMYDNMYGVRLGIIKAPEIEALNLPEMEKVPPYVSPLTAQLAKQVEELKDTPEKKEARKKAQRAHGIIAGIADVIAHIANIWGAAKGATPAKLSSLSKANEEAYEKVETKMKADLKEAEKALAESIKSDKEITKGQEKHAYNIWKTQSDALTKAWSARTKSAQDRYMQAVKASDAAWTKYYADKSKKEQMAKQHEYRTQEENQKQGHRVALESQKQGNRVAMEGVRQGNRQANIRLNAELKDNGAD